MFNPQQIRSQVEAALAILPNTYYQPPHWDHEPTLEEQATEDQYLKECTEACVQVKELADMIYLQLTGERVRHTK